MKSGLSILHVLCPVLMCVLAAGEIRAGAQSNDNGRGRQNRAAARAAAHAAGENGPRPGEAKIGEARRLSAQAASLRGGVARGKSRRAARTQRSTEESSPTLSVSGAVAGGGVCLLSEENCQAPDLDDALASNRRALLHADDFTPQVGGNVTEICWHGAYGSIENGDGLVDCQGQNPDTFVVRYYLDADGIPGDLIREFSQSEGTLTVLGPEATGDIIAGILPEYVFSAMHAPLPLSAGTCYWIEISNDPSDTCIWFWETSSEGNRRAIFDGGGIADPPDGYEPGTSDEVDLAFCVNLELDDPVSCLPPRPGNDNCADAEAITQAASFSYDNTEATTDGLDHVRCLAFSESQIANDVWFCWTAPCTGVASVQTGGTVADTKIAVYQDCDVCPPTDSQLLFCNDDVAPPENRLSEVWFPVFAGDSYLLRIGNFPGTARAPGIITVTCDEPQGNPSCPGEGDCFSPETPLTPGCSGTACCEMVCTCDPFCCSGEGEWDSFCAGTGFDRPGCGAQVMCTGCGQEESGDCCTANNTPGCSDAECCQAVCACDPDCCGAWDEICATRNAAGDCGAQIVCPDLCFPHFCPTPGPDEVEFLDPPSGVLDARQPHPPHDASQLQGIDRITLRAPPGADPECFVLCEPDDTAGISANSILEVTEEDGVFTVQLARPITPGAVTTLTYRPNAGESVTGTFIRHPGNVNRSGSTSALDDMNEMRDLLEGRRAQREDVLIDVDHSGLFRPGDLPRLVDLLNGGDQFRRWDGETFPSAGNCPIP